MIKKILVGVVVLIAAVFGYAAMQPADYVISRELAMRATPEKIFPHLNNSKLMNDWGPWLEADPQAKMVYSGPEQGVGARTSWDSEGQLGTGSATVSESVLNQKVSTHLEYSKPYPMTQESEMAIRPGTDGTSVVSWTVRGQNNVMGRVMCLFMNMDKMVGGMFEKGLNNLKARVEKG